MRYRKYLLIGIVIGLVSALMLPGKKESGKIRDYADIADEGILRATIEYGTNYLHINDEGAIEGFHYHLIKEFAEEHGLTLEVIPEMDLSAQDKLLKEGACDLIANGRPLTMYTDSTLRQTLPTSVDRQVLIQRKEEQGDTLCTYLKSQIDLAGKEVCIPQGSSAIQRIRHLMEEIGDSIYIREIPGYGAEQLMAMTAHGDICYAVCEENIVRAHIHQYPQLDDGLVLGFNQFYSWTVNAHSPTLLDSLNTWIERKGFRFKENTNKKGL